MNLQMIICTRMRSIYPLMRPRSSTFLPSSPIVTLRPPQEKVKSPPLRDINPTSQPWQTVSSASMQLILDVGCTMNLTGMPIGSALSNVPRRMVCSGVPVLRGRSQLSPSKNAGRRQHRGGSKKTPTPTRVLTVMGSIGTNQQANHLAMLTSWTPILLISIFLRHRLRNANGLRPLPQRHDVNA